MTNANAATNTSPEQTAYMIARATHDAALSEVTRRAPMPGPDASDDVVDAWLEESERAHAELQVDALSALLARAEEALLAWSFAVARRQAASSPAALRAVDMIESKIGKALHLTTRTKAIDLALRLAA